MAATPDMMAAMEDMSETESEEGEDNSEQDSSYEGDDLTVPPQRYEKLEVDGHVYDLRDPQQAVEAQEATTEYYNRYRSGEVYEYEGKSTAAWKGGRSRVFYDKLRADMAVDHHNGDYPASWEQQHEEAKRVVKVVAIKAKARGV